MIKVYEVPRMNAARLFTTYFGVSVELNFKNGNLLRGVNANLVTNDRFIQDAIEHDARFGITIRLKSSYPESDDDKETVAKEKNKRQSRTATTREQRASKDAYTSVEEVNSINDVISYFASLGETVEEESQIEELKEKYKVKFPNLK